MTLGGTMIEGYASLFGVPDMAGDVVVRGAFADSLRHRGASGIRMLYQHDATQPLGIWTEAFETGTGLYVRGRLNDEVVRAREIAALIRDGALDGLSIGFRTVQARRFRATGLRNIVIADLWEVSIVTFPLHPHARIRHSATHSISAERLRQAASIISDHLH